MSNSQASFRWSHVRTANRCPLRLDMLRLSRGMICRSTRSFPSMAPSAKARSASLLPTKVRSASSLPSEGAERRKAQFHCDGSLRRSRTGLRGRSRPTALHRGVFNPWDPACLGPGGVRRFRRRDRGRRKERALGAIVRREANPGTPGSTACEAVRAGTAPHPRSVSLCRAPLSEWGRFETYIKDKIMSI